MPSRGGLLFASVDIGGNWSPTLGLAAQMVDAGHRVRILGTRLMRGATEAVGAEFVEMSTSVELPRGIAAEDDDWAWYSRMSVGPEIASAMLGEVERDPPDVLVIDYVLLAALAVATNLDIPVVMLIHSYLQSVDTPGVWDGDVEMLEQTLDALDLPALEGTTTAEKIHGLWARIDVGFSLVPEWWTPVLPSNIVCVGPISLPRPSTNWDLPWSPDDERPMIVISMSSTYMHQENVLERSAAAAAGLDANVVLSLAGALEESDILIPDGVVVRTWLEFGVVLPRAAALVTHGGMATAAAGLLHGLPMVVLPLGRDQGDNGLRIQESGAGLLLEANAGVEEIRTAIRRVLSDDGMREAARNQGRALRELGNGALAVRELERQLGRKHH